MEILVTEVVVAERVTSNQLENVTLMKYDSYVTDVIEFSQYATELGLTPAQLVKQFKEQGISIYFKRYSSNDTSHLPVGTKEITINELKSLRACV